MNREHTTDLVEQLMPEQEGLNPLQQILGYTNPLQFCHQYLVTDAIECLCKIICDDFQQVVIVHRIGNCRVKAIQVGCSVSISEKLMLVRRDSVPDVAVNTIISNFSNIQVKIERIVMGR